MVFVHFSATQEPESRSIRIRAFGGILQSWLGLQNAPKCPNVRRGWLHGIATLICLTVFFVVERTR